MSEFKGASGVILVFGAVGAVASLALMAIAPFTWLFGPIVTIAGPLLLLAVIVDRRVEMRYDRKVRQAWKEYYEDHPED